MLHNYIKISVDKNDIIQKIAINLAIKELLITSIGDLKTHCFIQNINNTRLEISNKTIKKQAKLKIDLEGDDFFFCALVAIGDKLNQMAKDIANKIPNIIQLEELN